MSKRQSKKMFQFLILGDKKKKEEEKKQRTSQNSDCNTCLYKENIHVYSQ